MLQLERLREWSVLRGELQEQGPCDHIKAKLGRVDQGSKDILCLQYAIF